MRAVVYVDPGRVAVTTVADPRIEQPTDVLVRVTHAAVCGSDLLFVEGRFYAPEQRCGHEFTGVVEETGSAVTRLRRGDAVVAPFAWADGSCRHCLAGLFTSCPAGGVWGLGPGSDGGQGEAVRVPHADATLVRLPGEAVTDPVLSRSVLALADAVPTGHHAVVRAGVGSGQSVAVVGDGAVGLSAVLAARRAGAGRIIALGSHPRRLDLARRFGATDTVAAKGGAAREAVAELVGPDGVDAAVEAVGTTRALDTAIALVRPGGTVGCVGLPHHEQAPDLRAAFFADISLRGGIAPVRAYLPELLAEVLDGRLDPSPLFDFSGGLDDTPAAYGAMSARTALKALIRP
ncbi:zinc-binding dehydrogenase [Kitasatospora sp. NPDC004272]